MTFLGKKQSDEKKQGRETNLDGKKTRARDIWVGKTKIGVFLINFFDFFRPLFFLSLVFTLRNAHVLMATFFFYYSWKEIRDNEKEFDSNAKKKEEVEKRRNGGLQGG
jgi:hypothetical protein